MNYRQVSSSKKIVFVNAYSSSNRGDLGIVVAMADFVRRYIRDPDITVLSDYVDQNREVYSRHGLRALPNVWTVRGDSILSKYRRGVRAALLSPQAGKSHDHEGYAAIRDADLVLSVGGGYLYSSRRGPLGAGFLGVLFHLHLANRLRKPVIVFPISVGPLRSGLDARLMRQVLSKVELVCSREPITTNLLANLRLSNVVEVPDIAFILKPGNPIPLPKVKQRLRLGVTVLDWGFARATGEGEIKDYVGRVKNVVNQISAVRPVHVFIFPQVTVGDKDSDLAISKELRRQLGDHRSSVINLEKARPEDIIATYSQVDLFLASRMHSAIFAMAGKVPTIALSYQPKTQGTFAMLGVPQRSFDIASFDPMEVAQALLDSLGESVDIDLEAYYGVLGMRLAALTEQT
jgi:colanic acid/amylovoran biosynthesis protein